MKKITFFILSLLCFITTSEAQLEVNQGTAITDFDAKNGYAIIGDETGTNLTFDENELQIKLANDPQGSFFLNYRAGTTIIGGPNSGNVRIGANNGNNKLSVNVFGADGVGVIGDNTGNAWYRINNGGGIHYLFDDFDDANTLKLQSASEIAFNYSGANEAMRIQDDGDLYIGHDIIGGANTRVSIDTDENQVGLNLVNDYTTGATNGLISICNGSGNGNRTGLFGVANGPSTGALMIGVYGLGNTLTASNAYGVYGEVVGNSAGINRYGIYGQAPTNSGESWALYGNGDIYYTGSFTAPSDRRLKMNIQKAPNKMLDKIMQLEVKSYEYNKAAFPHINLAEGTQIGFIAQELMTVFPEVVQKQRHTFTTPTSDNSNEEKSVIEEELYGVEYIEMIPILTKAIQEQQQQIEALKAEIKALTERD